MLKNLLNKRRAADHHFDNINARWHRRKINRVRVGGGHFFRKNQLTNGIENRHVGCRRNANLTQIHTDRPLSIIRKNQGSRRIFRKNKGNSFRQNR